MSIKHISLSVLFLLSTSLTLTACSPGMPRAASQSAPKIKAPIAGKNYKLIPITYKTIARSNAGGHAPKTGKARGTGGYNYRIGPQDILTITVWDHPELTIPAGEFRSASAAGHRVGKDGKFFFPFAGRIQAKGLTPEQIRLTLQKKLAKFITKPQVGVAVAAYRSQKAFISGEVAKPGVFNLNDVPLTIRDIIAKAGGLNKATAASTALLVRGNKERINVNLNALLRKGDNSHNYVLRNGDTLYINKKNLANKVFVMGEVRRPGTLTYNEEGLSLAEALSDAGSIIEDTADPRGVFVIRQENHNDKIPTVYQLQMTSVHTMLYAERFRLRPRDVVYVTASPIVRWNRVISRVLPSITGVTSASNIGN